MMRSRKLILCLVWWLLSPYSFAAELPATSPRHRVGILRLGELSGPVEEKAYPLMEKRIQRWLENFPNLASQVRPLSVSVRGEEIRLESEQSQLDALAESLLETPEDGNTLLPRIRELRSKLRPIPRYSPAVQKSLLAEAKLLWSAGNVRQSSSLIQEALLLHPDVVSQEGDGWDTEKAMSAFDGELFRKSSEIKRICSVEVRTFPEEASITVNGFPMGKRRQFQLAGGAQYHFTVAAAGFEPDDNKIQCDRSSKRDSVVRLKRQNEETIARTQDLAKVTQGNGVGSLCLIEAKEDRFRLYLFSPGVALDEIPLQAPLRIAEVARQPASGTVPVSSDAFLALFEKHRVAQGYVAMNTSAEPSLAVAGRVETTEAQWYNDWKFWAITGGVLAGVAGAYFATKAPEVKTQGGMIIHWE